MGRVRPSLLIALLLVGALVGTWPLARQCLCLWMRRTPLSKAPTTQPHSLRTRASLLRGAWRSRAVVEYRRLFCLAHRLHWDDATERVLQFVNRRRGTIWEPRGLYLLGQILTRAPHRCFVAGWRLVRNW
jgi:hypothetical protein